ncbi:MAG: hypothetical protein ACFB0C_19485 [Leptolyngbyaceae cyanobacterium]
MTVDLQARPVTVTIHNGVDALDCSPIYESLNLESNGLDLSGWVRITGTLRLLAFVDDFAEDCNRRINPTRWALGNVVSVSVDFGGATGVVPLPWRLKIIELPDIPHPEQSYIDIRVGGDADLKQYRATQGNAGGVPYGTNTNRDVLMNAMLAEAGLPSLIDSITDYPIPFAPQKSDPGSWVVPIGKTGLLANRLLWQQADGSFRAALLTLTGLSPIAHYTIGADEVRVLPSAGDKAPPAKVRVTASTYNLTTLDNTSTTVDIVESGQTVGSITTQYLGRGTTTQTKIVTHRRKRGDILPDYFPGNNSQFDAYRHTLVESYNAIDGTLEQTTETIEEPAGLHIGELISSGYNTLIIRTRTTTDYFYTAKKLVRQVNIKIEEPRAIVLPDSWGTNASQPTTAERITDKWNRIGDDVYDASRSSSNSREDRGKGSQFQQPSPKPPATKYQPSATTKEEVPFVGEASFSGLAGTDFADKPWEITTPGGLGTNPAQCQDVAQTWGEIRHGKAFPVTWAGPLTPEWLQSYSPVLRFDATLNGTRTAYLIEGFTLQMDTRSQSVGGLGVEIGIVARAGSGTPSRPFVQP